MTRRTALRRRGGRPRPPRRLAAVATLALAAAIAAAPSRADGDPASDYLLTQSVYVPYQAPSPTVLDALARAVDDVYVHGNRVKVALIYSEEDMGSIPSLFGQPADYARFLGVELGLWYIGPLLVVMPAGFGIYDGGRSTAAEEQVLRSVPISAGSPDELAGSAKTALERLAAAGALSSADIRAPFVTAHPATARRGKPVTLHFDLFDDSGRSRASVRVYEGGSLVATLTTRLGFGISTRKSSVRWLVPAKLYSRQLRFCVIASDPAGNRSAPACAPFLRIS